MGLTKCIFKKTVSIYDYVNALVVCPIFIIDFDRDPFTEKYVTITIDWYLP